MGLVNLLSTDRVPGRRELRGTWSNGVSAKNVLLEVVTATAYDTSLSAKAQRFEEAFPSLRLGYLATKPSVTPGRDTFTVDFRMNTDPPYITYGELASRLDHLVSGLDLERLEPVPSGETSAEGAAKRDEVAAQVDREQQASNPLDRLGQNLTGAAKGLRTVFVAGAIIALVVAAFVYLPRSSK